MAVRMLRPLTVVLIGALSSIALSAQSYVPNRVFDSTRNAFSDF
jgi:hypothetical membrane protein